ncbi:MAG: hypothetical protein ACTSVY_01785 [Candidatus Helarchaeota archaeon]
MRVLSKPPWNAPFREFTHEDIIKLRNSLDPSFLAQFLLELVDEKRIAPHVLLVLFRGDNGHDLIFNSEKLKKRGKKGKYEKKNKEDVNQHDILELF